MKLSNIKKAIRGQKDKGGHQNTVNTVRHWKSQNLPGNHIVITFPVLPLIQNNPSIYEGTETRALGYPKLTK
jgi:hypothetical protein